MLICFDENISIDEMLLPKKDNILAKDIRTIEMSLEDLVGFTEEQLKDESFQEKLYSIIKQLHMIVKSYNPKMDKMFGKGNDEKSYLYQVGKEIIGDILTTSLLTCC